MKTWSLTFSLALSLTMTAGLTGCGPSSSNPPPGPPIDLAVINPVDGGSDLAVPLDQGQSCTCDTPPATTCTDGNTLRSYGATGACDGDGGACSYPSGTTSCPNGCFQGACVGALSFLGNTTAYLTGVTSNNIVTDGMTIPTNQSVTIVTQTYPAGAASDVHLVYSANGQNLTSTNVGVDLAMTYDKITSNNAQWYAVIPAQPAGQRVYWYIYADANGLTVPLYYSNSGANFSYTTTAGPADLSDVDAIDLSLCACATPPAATCATPKLTTSSAGVCELDGGDHCDYPTTTSACMYGCYGTSCNSGGLSFLGNSAAYAGSNGQVQNGGNVAPSQAVSIVTQTYPHGATGAVHLVYAVGPINVANPGTDVVLNPDSPDVNNPNNDTWYAVIPGQSSGVTIYWYLYTAGFGGVATLYDSNNSANYDYTVH